jgi:hypothetical protein
MTRKSFGLQTIDQKLTNLLKPIFAGNKKEFILINNLVKNWPEIVGKKYSEFCYPKSVNFEKDKSSAKLTIAVHNASIGFFLEQNSELIIERIASLYGFKSISKIIFKQEPKHVEGSGNTEIRLSNEKENFLKEKIKDVSDEELAETLKKLGREVFRKED